MLQDELMGSRPPRWREENGIVRFSVISDGTTGKQWAARLKCTKGAKQVLQSPNLPGRQAGFTPTNGVESEIVVLRGTLFTDDYRTTRHIRTKGVHRALSTPSAEAACLIREQFTDKDLRAMGLWRIVAMHEPIEDSGGDPCLLVVGRGVYGRWLDVGWGAPDSMWDAVEGFAFTAP